ncbi:thioredoxin [Desulfosporosinus sp. OT]|uniref:thioredoxin n=1 Tax=Desulfosporosinus sp. OT TaxID=913865 RepID=UPI0002239E13|nr:thioredoxin [Desulfosporosinus sp. OT]EGW40122.1 thioredoxin [Desulfosporosinus sp. OT]
MASANVKTFTTANFESEVLKSEKAVLVDFWASWCNPCRMEAPIIDELADEYLGQIVVGKVDVDDNGPIVSNYSVVSIPTISLFKGGKVVDMIAGFHGKKKLVKMLNDQL